MNVTNVLNLLDMKYNYLNFIRCCSKLKRDSLNETINKLTSVRGYHTMEASVGTHKRIMRKMNGVRIYKCYCLRGV